MESLSTSLLKIPLPPSSAYSFSNLATNKRIGYIKFAESSSNFGGVGLRIHALARQVPGESEDEKPVNNVFGLVSGDSDSLSQVLDYSLIVLISESSIRVIYRDFFFSINWRTLRYGLMFQFCVNHHLHVCLILNIGAEEV